MPEGPFDPDSPQAKQMADSIRGALGDNVLGEYLTRLQTDLGISLNETGMNQATGASSPVSN